MNKNVIGKKVWDDTFRKHHTKAKVYLRSSKTKGSNFDPYRNTGYVKINQNYTTIKVLERGASPQGLIQRNFGLTESGAIQILVKNASVDAIRLSNKVIINDKEYYVYNDAVGGRFQIYPLQFGYSKIILFRKEV